MTGAAGSELERLLQRCAAQDAQARAQIEALYGPRLRSMLARRVRRPELVEAALEAALDDICARAGEHDPEHQPAEDWLFGRARAVAASGRLADAAPARREGRLPVRPRQVEQPVHRQSEEASEELPAQERVRRPWARRRLAAVLAVLVAGVLGAVAGLMTSRPPEPGPVHQPQAVVLPIPDVAPAHEAAPPSGVARPSQAAPLLEPEPPPAAAVPPTPELPPVERIEPPPDTAADPTWWDLPTTDPAPAEPPTAAVVPESRAPAAPPAATAPEREVPAATPPSGPRRVFIHHTAGSGDGAALARLLSERLPRDGFEIAGIRTVPFQIGSGGVRYFFAQDREEARQLLAASMRALGRGASPLPRGAGDFTHYAPKPQPGTIEIWLSTR